MFNGTFSHSKYWHLKSERLSELMQKRLELLIVVTIKSIKDWVDFVSHKIYSEYNFIFFLLLFKLDMLGKISEFIPLNLV